MSLCLFVSVCASCALLNSRFKSFFMNFIYTLARFRHLTLTVIFCWNFEISLRFKQSLQHFLRFDFVGWRTRPTYKRIRAINKFATSRRWLPSSLLPPPFHLPSSPVPAACLMCNFCRCSLKIITSALGQENGNGKKAAKLTAEETWWRGRQEVVLLMAWHRSRSRTVGWARNFLYLTFPSYLVLFSSSFFALYSR